MKTLKTLSFLLLTIRAGVFSFTPGFGQSIQFHLKDAPFSHPKSGLSVCDNGMTNGLAVTDIRYSSFGSDNSIVKFQLIIQGDTLVPNAMATPGEMFLQLDGKTTAKTCFENYKKTSFERRRACHGSKAGYPTD